MVVAERKVSHIHVVIPQPGIPAVRSTSWNGAPESPGFTHTRYRLPLPGRDEYLEKGLPKLLGKVEFLDGQIVTTENLGPTSKVC